VQVMADGFSLRDIPARSKQVKQGRLRVQVIITPLGTAPLNPP